MRLIFWIKISKPCPCKRYSKSSVATFPEAPAAYGHPPSPAMEESNILMPCSRPAYIFANA
ncbi:uncharacterized protein V1478_017706 [Vespula squamosa]|uniref:Uncharacterized protein n=1 Tax=Vespula squamosa TaxID=30214 RepID=A0ABD1ZWK7_VESSQ